jgi:hypothetical protein
VVQPTIGDVRVVVRADFGLWAAITRSSFDWFRIPSAYVGIFSSFPQNPLVYDSRIVSTNVQGVTMTYHEILIWWHKPMIRIRWGRIIYAVIVACATLESPLMGFDPAKWLKKYNTFQACEGMVSDIDEPLMGLMLPSLLLPSMPITEWADISLDGRAPDLKYVLSNQVLVFLIASALAAIGIFLGTELIMKIAQLCMMGLHLYTSQQQGIWRDDVTTHLHDISSMCAAINGSMLTASSVEHIVKLSLEGLGLEKLAML